MKLFTTAAKCGMLLLEYNVFCHDFLYYFEKLRQQKSQQKKSNTLFEFVKQHNSNTVLEGRTLKLIQEFRRGVTRVNGSGEIRRKGIQILP